MKSKWQELQIKQWLEHANGVPKAPVAPSTPSNLNNGWKLSPSNGCSSCSKKK